MGMSTNIKAFISDKNNDYLKHKKILLFCLENDVSLPKETAEYFGSDYGYKDLLDEKLEIHLKEGEHYYEWHDEYSRGYEIDLTKLPNGVHKIRFYNSW